MAKQVKSKNIKEKKWAKIRKVQHSNDKSEMKKELAFERKLRGMRLNIRKIMKMSLEENLVCRYTYAGSPLILYINALFNYYA